MRAPDLAASLAFLLLACACAGSGSATEEQDRPRVSSLGEGAVLVSLGDEPFCEFHFADTTKPYLHPLLGPGGVPLTRAFPMAEAANESSDHPHHQSLWFAHGNVNGHDFWHGALDRAWIETVAVEATTERRAAVLRVANLWKTGAEDVLLAEQRVMLFRELPGGDRAIDFEIGLRSIDRELVFGDTKEGSFALRLRPELRLNGPVAAGHILDAEGRTDGDCWGERAAWIDYSAEIDGEWLGVAIFDHPDNPRHPTWWHARDYGLVAANPFGIHDFDGEAEGAGDLTLPQGETLRFRYRVLLHRGQGQLEALQEAWQRFAENELPR